MVAPLMNVNPRPGAPPLRAETPLSLSFAWIARVVLLAFVAVVAVVGTACTAADDSEAAVPDETSTGTGAAMTTAEPTGTSTGADDTTGAQTTGGSADETGSDSSETGAPAQCPTHIRTERIASLVEISYGWTGQGHGADPVDGMVTTYELVDCDDECRRCRFRGPVPNDPSIPNDPRRCLNMFPQACESDADCGDEPGACQFMIVPPLQRTTSWTAGYAPALSDAQMAAFGVDDPHGAQGVVNLETGEFDYEVLNQRITLGPGFSEVCVGDTTPDDGVEDGTCADSGVPCDVATLSPNGNLSFQCSWTPNVIDFALPAHGASTGGFRWEMDATRPNCTVPGAESLQCWCGVCTEGDNIPCQSDADCEAGTCGSAGGDGLVVLTLPNLCAPGETCDWDPVTLRGTCPNSEGQAVECMPADGEWVVEGSTSVQDEFFISTIALLSCLPEVDPNRLIIVDPVNDISLDEAFGFPGPITQSLALKITPEFR